MKVVGIIAEYNPFHNGHLYQINKIKEELNPDYIIAIMSPNFTMRGEPAIISKIDRANIALLNGIDLVIEFPTKHAVQAADIFAYYGVSYLNKLHITHLSFGVETTNTSLLKEIASHMETDSYKQQVKVYQKQGYSFKKASFLTLVNINDDFKDILEQPNNILAIEYLRSIKKINSLIEPHFVKRTMNNYFDITTNNSIIQSASTIRNLIKNKEDFTSYLPNGKIEPNFHFMEDYFPFIKYQILCLSKNQIAILNSIKGGMDNKLKSAVNANDLPELINTLLTKDSREQKINRLLIYLLLNISKQELNQPIEYISILGFTKKGQSYLNIIKKNVDVLLITHMKRGLPQSYYREQEITKIYELPNKKA